MNSAKTSAFAHDPATARAEKTVTRFSPEPVPGYFVEAVKSPVTGGAKQAVTTRSLAALPTTTRSIAAAAAAPMAQPVVVTLMGGLGNQMFQYAAGLALATKRQVPLQLDLTFLQDKNPRPNFTPRNYALEAFPLHAGCTLITNAAAMPAELTTVTEKSFAYDPAAADAPAGSRLNGYWQCARYFEEMAADVKKSFASVPQLSKAAQSLAAQIQAGTAVCLHVRRGDMIHNAHTASVHGSCPIEYYQAASDVMAQKYPDAHFYIFSDDADWCAKNDLTRGRPCTVARPDDQPGNAVVDLFLMRHCRHFIIANSTFSWWAAYLGDFSGKTVIAPEPWLNSTAIDTSDLLPKDWIRLCRNPGPIVADQSAAPLVSVIMPCYKQANYLHEAIASVVAQTYPDWELIVVNDGSPDETSRVTREIIALHPERRIRLLEKVNGGLADARNAGIREARGRYILPLDSDDRVHPEILQKTVALLNTNKQIAIAYTDLIHFGVANKIVRASEYDPARLPIQNQLNYCSLYRREVWSATGGYNCNMIWGYEDWDFWVGCAEKGFVAKRIPEALLHYRVKQASMYTTAVEHHRDNHARIVLNHPGLYNEATRREAAKILAKTPPARAIPALPKNPVVSVVIPCWNQAAYLPEAVESVIAQTYTDWEIIIVNDGSPDNTSEVAQSLIRSHPAHRIRLIEKPNGGASDARNAGIHFAQGGCILPLDGDDKIAPEFLARTVALLEQRPEIGVAYTDWVYFGARNGRRNALEYDFARLCTKENLFTCTALYRKKAWEAAGGYNHNMTHGVEDWDFWISCGEQGFKGQRIPEPLFFYRAKAEGRNQAVLPHLPAMFARIILNHPKVYGAEAVRLAQKKFEAAQLPPPKASSPGEEWLPPTTTLAEFSKIIADAEALVRAARIEDAITLVEHGLCQAPTAECATRAREILDLLRAELKPAPAAAAASASFSDDELFGADEVDGIQQIIVAYSNAPTDSVLRNQLVELQQGLMKFLVTAEPGKLEGHFRGSLGSVFRALLKSGFSSEPASEALTAQCAVLDEAIGAAEKAAVAFDVRPLLARILCGPAHRGAVRVALEKIPAWLLDEYLGYVLFAPPVFVAAGEAEDYRAHLLYWSRTIRQLTRTRPGDPLTNKVAQFFAMRASYIPLYFSNSNTRELAENRAAIMEFVLTRNGAVIDTKFPKRSKPRAKIRVGYVNAHFGAQTETHVTLPTMHLDRNKFEICLFAVASNPGPINDYARSLADSFTLLPQNYQQQVKVIRAAALDVVIIGTNVTAVSNAVALIALHRLAPLQLASYCSPVSTGMRHIDGYLTGTLNDCPGLQDHFTEKLHFCEGPPGCLDYAVEAAGSGTRFDRASLRIATDDVVFVNAAACFKILPEMQETWAKILASVPKSRLLLLPFNPNWANAFPVKQFERTLTEACARHGVSRDRFVLANSLPSRADVKSLERIADVYLDTFPFSGSISVIDPLELGLPPVVQEGTTHRSRMASALLREIDLPELITKDENSYIELAVQLGTDAAYRRQLKERILTAMARRPRFINAQSYAEGLGELLESLVRVK